MTPNSTTLTVKFNGIIASPPATNRENFKQCVINTLLSVLRSQDVAVEFIGYRPDPVGVHTLGSARTEYEDSVYASLSINRNSLLQADGPDRKQHLIRAFVETFENAARRHLEVEYVNDEEGHDIEIQMNSDWTWLLAQG